MPPPKEQNLSVPIAIIVAGALIAGALFFAGRSAEPKPPATDTDNSGSVTVFVPVTASDHILGNPNADIIIVEYSDIECPFCKQFHATMQQIMNKYGKDGKVAWVYRNFPLVQLHPNAPKLAEAAECVAELGGNNSYWKFLDAVFTIAPAGTFFDMSRIASTAASVGVSESAFNSCLTSGKYKEKIQKEYNDALAAGGNGTPYSIMVTTKSGDKQAIPGAQPYAAVEAAIERALAR